MFYIYKFYNKNSILYVGKTTNIYSRFNSHKNSKDWFIEATHIHVGKCNNKIDMDIYELYYINKLTPPYKLHLLLNLLLLLILLIWILKFLQ